MSDAISCPKCQHRLRLPEGTAGEEIECPSCGGSFPRPGAAADSEIDSAIAVTAPARTPAKPDERTNSRRDSDRSSRERERPRRDPIKKKSSSGLVIGLLVGGVVLVALFCTALGGYIYSSRKHATHDAHAKPAAEWKTFTAPDGRFSIDMPGTPVQRPITDGSRGVKYLYEDKKAELTYAVTYIDWPDGLQIPADLLAKMVAAERDDLLKRVPGSQVDGERDLPANPYLGREIRIKSPSGSGLVIDRVLLVKTRAGTRFYIVVVGGRQIVADAGDAARFFNSFKSLEPADGPADPEKKPPTEPEKKPPQYLLGPAGPDEVNNLKPHSDRTNAFLLMPGGDTLLTAGADGKLKIWEVPSFGLKFEADTLPKGANVLACSHDGRMLATASGRTVGVHDAATLKQRFTFDVRHTTHDNLAPVVEGLAFSPDGSILAVGVWCSQGRLVPGEIHFCDVAAQKEVQVVQAHRDGVRCLEFSPDGQTLATGGATQVILWDADKRQQRQTLEGHTHEVLTLGFSPDGATLATAGADHTVRVWDAASGKLRRTLEGHFGPVRSVSFASGSKLLASSGADGSVLLWNLETGKSQVALGRQGRTQTDVLAFSPDGKLLAVTRNDRQSIKILDPAKVQSRAPETFFSKTASPDDVGVQRVLAIWLWFTPDGKTLGTLTLDGGLQLWDLPGFTLRATRTGHPGGPKAFAHSPDGKKLAIAAGPLVYLRDGGTGELERSFTAIYTVSKRQVNDISSVALTPGGDTLAIGVRDPSDWRRSEVQIWDAAGERPAAVIPNPPAVLNEVAYTADGKMFLARGEREVKTWNAATRQEGVLLTGHLEAIRAMAIAPDSRSAVTCSEDRTARVYDLATGKTKFLIEGDFLRVAYSPDGTLIAAASENELTQLYDSSTGEFRGSCREKNARGTGEISFNADGKWLARALGGVVKVWDVSRARTKSPDAPPDPVSPPATPEETANLTGHTGGVGTLAFAPVGNRLVVGSRSTPLRLWQGDPARLLAELPATMPTDHVVYSKDGKQMATALWNGVVTIREGSSGRLIDLFRIKEIKRDAGYLRGLAFSPDGKTLAIAIDTTVGAKQHGELHLWDLSGRKSTAVMDFNLALNRVAYLPDGSALVTAAGTEVKFWNSATREELFACKGHTGVVTGLAVAFGGDRIATAGADKTIKVWDAKNGNLLQTIEGHASPVADVAWSPDGKLLASSGDNLFRLWDSDTGKKRAAIPVPPQRFPGPIAFRADGKVLAGGAGDTVNLWDVDMVLTNLAPK
jgi:WD40 repeat protein